LIIDGVAVCLRPAPLGSLNMEVRLPDDLLQRLGVSA
jgi:hypothetical protein